MNISLKGEVVLVTGASRGIGAEIARTLGLSGATVAGTATSDEGATQITEMFKTNHINGQGFRLDVAGANECQDTVTNIEKTLGPITVLINNAGITRDNLLIRMKEDEWDDIMNTNLKSVYRLSKLVCRNMMKARSGRIINLTSVVGFLGNAGQSNYAAAKAGIVGFSKSLARELGGRNINVNCVAPGFIDTEMTQSLAEEQKKALINQVPLGRLGEVTDIANTVLFLSSDLSRYITGSTIHVNGGMLME
ncbi:3-oxoacyl-ACP reductase FabG [Burkholderiales bacterium]|nr:3-oxoacyl-ACP reductase FabG [Burkholderiales bacterium]